MDESAIKSTLQKGLPQCELEIAVEGNKLSLKIISDEFDGLSRVKRQQKIYVLLDDRIKSGEIHAVSMVTMTVAEANQ
jgi:acid stress-induced BolA-like protein IbaG/YrbA